MKINKKTDRPLFAEERREKIVEQLRKTSKILVQDLCEYFDVSSATIRSDLSILEKQGHLKRTHGGAISVIRTGFEATTKSKLIENIDKKQRISSFARTLVEPGDIVAIDSGSTTFEFAKQLTSIPNLTIVTYDINIATYLDSNSSNTVYLVGGVLRKGFDCTVGNIAISNMKKFNVDKAFMATNAFSIEKGFTTPNSELAECKKAMLSIANSNYMLMDSHKFGMISFMKFAEIRDIDSLIIDSDIDKQSIDAIRNIAPDMIVNTV